MTRSLKVMYLGDLGAGTTSMQRYWAMVSLGHRVLPLMVFPRSLGLWQRADNWLYRRGLDYFGFHSRPINEQICYAGHAGTFDLIWIDKGNYVTDQTIETLKKDNPGLKVVGYSPDYMAARHNNSRWFIRHSKYYDLFITTKSYAVDWHRNSGCKKVLFQGNAYDPAIHKPVQISTSDRTRMGDAVGFIGSYELERWRDIAYLGSRGIEVKVYGGDWGKIAELPGVKLMRRAVMGTEYAEVIQSFDINLCFLRKMNFDLQTQRSVEIPACGGFMLAERTEEHLALFKEGKEADFFGSREELFDKCSYYIKRPHIRKKIALAGRLRCLRSKYSYPDRIAEALAVL